MGELRDRLVAVQSGEATEKLSLYSAHDYTLIPLLIGLGAMPGEVHECTHTRIHTHTKMRAHTHTYTNVKKIHA